MFRVILHDFQMLRERRDVDVVDTLPGLDVPEVAGVLLVRRRHRVPLCAQLRRLRAGLPAGVGARIATRAIMARWRRVADRPSISSIGGSRLTIIKAMWMATRSSGMSQTTKLIRDQ